MMTGKIHFDTKVEGEEFTFICAVGSQTARAFQAADEFRSYFYGKMKEQHEQQAKAEKAPEEIIEAPQEG